AWRLWNEDKSMELIDKSMSTISSSSVEDVLRCIHVGLLCVQKRTEQRPTMSSVLLMLSSEAVVLPKPQVPGFFVERDFIKEHSSQSDKESCISNEATITLLEAR
ncbi:S-receptor-like serine/threonine-protein kinase, partial [Thalictrum thalictroides]